MIKIKYVGVKQDGERAFKADTGIEWFIGDEHEVSEENAAKMLRHPDVFVQVAGKAVKPAKAPSLKAVAADQDEVEDEAIAREAAAKKAKDEADAKAAQEADKKADPVVEAKKPAREIKAPKAPLKSSKMANAAAKASKKSAKK